MRGDERFNCLVCCFGCSSEECNGPTEMTIKGIVLCRREKNQGERKRLTRYFIIHLHLCFNEESYSSMNNIPQLTPEAYPNLSADDSTLLKEYTTAPSPHPQLPLLPDDTSISNNPNHSLELARSLKLV